MEDRMEKPVAPQESEEAYLGPLDFQTVLLLADIHEAFKAEGHDEELPVDLQFEFASQLSLAAALRRPSPGKTVTGMGGTPVVDWIFCSTPYRNKAKDALVYPTTGVLLETDIEVWIRDLLTPLTLWVMDLPASESNHHAYPHGLLDHMLEVALAATTECASKLGPDHWQGKMSERAFGQALRLSMALGVLHDIGKVFNVEVKDKKSGETWDPMREPLAYFKARHEIPILEPTPFRFMKGRGLNGHEDKGKKLIPLVVHPKIWKRMGPDIAKAYGAYLGRYASPAVARPAPLDFVADCVHRADGASAGRKEAKPGEYLLELHTKAAAEVA
jgi:hypothetical protein